MNVLLITIVGLHIISSVFRFPFCDRRVLRRLCQHVRCPEFYLHQEVPGHGRPEHLATHILQQHQRLHTFRSADGNLRRYLQHSLLQQALRPAVLGNYARWRSFRFLDRLPDRFANSGDHSSHAQHVRHGQGLFPDGPRHHSILREQALDVVGRIQRGDLRVHRVHPRQEAGDETADAGRSNEGEAERGGERQAQ